MGRRIRSLLLLGFVTLLSSQLLLAQPATGFERVDQLRDDGRFEEALELLEQMQGDGATGPEFLWRLAWTRVDLGEVEARRERQDALFRQALVEARHAVELDPDNATAHLVRGIAAGRTALIAGTREKIELSREVRESADRSIELDPDSDGAYHMRGRWHFEVASLGFFARSMVRLVYGGLPDASFEAAAVDLQRAAEIEDRVLHRMELGRTYLALNDRERAREELVRALEMPDDDASAARYREEARDLLRQIR